MPEAQLLVPPPIVALVPLASLVPNIGSIPVPLALYSNGLEPDGVELPLNPKFVSAKTIKLFTVKGVFVESTQSLNGLLNILVEVPKYLLYIKAKGSLLYKAKTSIAQDSFGATKTIEPFKDICKLSSIISNFIIVIFLFKTLNLFLQMQ